MSSSGHTYFVNMSSFIYSDGFGKGCKVGRIMPNKEPLAQHFYRYRDEAVLLGGKCKNYIVYNAMECAHRSRAARRVRGRKNMV
jgi:hypothetical protein